MSNSSAPVVVGLVQLTEPMVEYMNLPYAVGLLQAYVMHYAADPRRYLFALPIFQRGGLTADASKLSLAQVVGFSTYVWNMQYSLALARRLKAQNPDVLIVFGGPHVPDHAEAFLRQNPCVDLAVHGPGETVFFQILESFPERDWSEIPSLSLINQQGEFEHHALAPRVNSDELPSPYLSGVMEPLLLAYPGQRWIAAWETNRGCPFSCTFCDWGSATSSKLKTFGMERLQAEIDWFAKHKIGALYCTDSNYGSLPRDVEISQRLIKSKQEHGYPQMIFTQTAKNVTERAYQVQKSLLDGGLNYVATLSLQSITPAVLKAIKRENISLKSYQELQKRFRQDGVPTYTDVLLGLPGESFESFIEGIGTIIAQGQHREMRIWNTFILPNAEMNDPDYRRQYQIESVFIKMFPLLQEAAEPPDGIYERQEMIVSTSTMPRHDWVRARVFAWIVQILYYSQSLQPAIMLLHEVGGLSYHEQLLAFMEGPLPEKSPVLTQLRKLLFTRAWEMVGEGPEYVIGVEPATGKPTWMSTDYFASLQLLYSPKLLDFFVECTELLHTLAARAKPVPPDALDDAIAVGLALTRVHHPSGQTFKLDLGYNIWDFYQNALLAEKTELRQEPWRLMRRGAAGGYVIESIALNPSAAKL